MLIAGLYDIHGNLPALEAVLEEIEEIGLDLLIIGGDVASGPLPRATIERLMQLDMPAHFVRGNADRELVDSFDGVAPNPATPEEVQIGTRWAAQQLDQAHRDFLAAFAEQVVITVEGLGDVLFCHGSPRSDEEILTRDTPEQRLRAAVADVTVQVVVCGHTHMQFDRMSDDIRVVNAGSVGMPYGAAGSHWILLGPQIVFKQTMYDLEQAAEQIRTSGYPQAQDFADSNVLNPPSEREAIDFFESLALQRLKDDSPQRRKDAEDFA